MADTPKEGETVVVSDSKTEGNPTGQPTIDPAEVERLRKEAEQATMRANQLENELAKKKQAEEDAKLKQLEEKEEWKSVAEQEKARREALEQEIESEKRAAELNKTKSEVFSQFPAEVIEIAEETGLGLSDTSEEAQEKLKEKLEKIKAKVVTEKKVTPNNPSNPTGVTPDREELLTRMRYGDKEARAKIISELPGVQAMREMSGYNQ